jgi:hypothetical protein
VTAGARRISGEPFVERATLSPRRGRRGARTALAGSEVKEKEVEGRVYVVDEEDGFAEGSEEVWVGSLEEDEEEALEFGLGFGREEEAEEGLDKVAVGSGGGFLRANMTRRDDGEGKVDTKGGKRAERLDAVIV